MSETLLLIEDEKLLGNELARHFRREGWDVVQAETLAQAREQLLERHLSPLVVVSDMSLPDGNALDLLESVRADAIEMRGPADHGEWVFLTGYGTVADSVRALRLGAYDFLEKPAEQKRLDLVVAGAARSASAQRRLEEQSHQQHEVYTIDAFVGHSAAASAAREMLRKLSQVPFSALVIGGETGTGKGLATRILHHSGQRRGGPLVEINCAALPKDLLESELFGHEAGAFTGAKKRRRGLIEQASGGTLFLDEIAELELDLQAKLLKAIEDQIVRPLGSEREVQVDVQFVAASNRDFAARIEEGAFREDLFHRLSVFSIELPPLRNRLEDLEDLVPVVIAEFNAKAGKSVRLIPDDVWAALKAHDWPGNVRELRNVVERCVLFSDGETFPIEWLQLDRDASSRPTTVATASGVPADALVLALDGSQSLEDIDRLVVSTALERASHNITAAARMLGTTRQTLRYRVQKYGLKTGGGEDDE